MRTSLTRVNLHTAIMVGGTNLQLRLCTKEKTGLVLAFDEEQRCLYVTYNRETMRVPEHNISGMIEGQAFKRGTAKVVETPAAPPPAKPVEAQYSTPMAHVHAGPGHGQTGQEEVTKRGPGRPKAT
jgi:hypothetical protein